MPNNWGGSKHGIKHNMRDAYKIKSVHAGVILDVSRQVPSRHPI